LGSDFVALISMAMNRPPSRADRDAREQGAGR
jgi:hypothetical protein